MDGRMWVAHHEAFGELVDRAGAALREVFNRMVAWDGTTHQLIALVLSFAITGLTFNSTAT